MAPPPKRKARRLHRGTGDRALAGFLERLAHVNAVDAPYAYRVRTVVLFGSYATNASMVGDVDLAVELEPKFPQGSPEQRALEAERRDTEHYHPRTMVEEIGWGMVEMYRVLQGRSPTLSVCGWGAMPPLQPGTPYRVLLGSGIPAGLRVRPGEPRQEDPLETASQRESAAGHRRGVRKCRAYRSGLSQVGEGPVSRPCKSAKRKDGARGRL